MEVPKLTPRPVVKRMIMVDDDVLAVKTYSIALRRLGWEVEPFTDPASVLTRIRAGDVTCLLSDLDMPGLGGKTLVQEARAANPHCVIVVLSGQQEIGTAVDLMSLGADDYLMKPARVPEIAMRLERAMSRRLLEQAHASQYSALRAQVLEQATSLEQVYNMSLVTMAYALDLRDPYTHGHSTRVGEYAGDLAEYLGLDSDMVSEIRLGGQLHDIGKLGMPDSILLKPDALTVEEFRAMQQHPLQGWDLLRESMYDRPMVLNIVRSHHERLSGKGYPDKLVGTEIPPEAMIVALADSFDAMTSSRPYRTARPLDTALAILRGGAGTDYDLGMTSAFCSMIESRLAKGLLPTGHPHPGVAPSAPMLVP